MLIDFHTHIFPDKIAQKTIDFLSNESGSTAYSDGTVSGLIAQMKKADCSLSVALPVLTKPTQFDHVNAFAKQVTENYSAGNQKIISFAGIHPFCDDLEGKMLFLYEQGFKGVKIHPEYQSTFIDDERYVKIVKCAKKYDMIVLTHAGVDAGYRGGQVKCSPQGVLSLLKKVDYEKIVLAHYGGNELFGEVLKCLAGTNVYFDTAFMMPCIDKTVFIKILEKHTADKVLFATDCPWRDISQQYEIIKSYKLSEEQENKIFYKNALNLLNIGV